MLCSVPIFCSFSFLQSSNGSSFPLMSYKYLTMTFNFNDITASIWIPATTYTTRRQSNPCSAYEIVQQNMSHASFNLVNCAAFLLLQKEQCPRFQQNSKILAFFTIFNDLRYLLQFCTNPRIQSIHLLLAFIVANKIVSPPLLDYSTER